MPSKKLSKQKVFSSLEEDEISKLSIESTDEEQYPSDNEYTVERILAQKSEDGQQVYLIRWAGFPEEASSWEPRRNILDKTIIDAWKVRQARESKSLDIPYDIGKLEALQKIADDSKARRDRLRREKRKRQGIVVSPHESDADNGEGQSKFPSTSVITDTLGGGERSSERQEGVQATRKSKIRRRERIDSDSSSDEPLSVNPWRESTSGTPSSTKVPKAKKQLLKRVTLQKTASEAPESYSAVMNVPKARGGGAMRGSSSVPQQNVFIGGKAARKPKPGLIQAAADPSKRQRHFTNTSILRKAELAGRALADAAPDLAALGGLIKPSESSSVRRPEILRGNIFAPQNENNNRGALPAQSPHKQPEDPERLSDNPLHVSEMPWEDVQHIPYEQRSICFFYSRPQGCHNRNHCKYQHVDDPLLPIAPPPDGWAESQKICFFYNLDGNCRNGDTCGYLHESGTDLPVSKPPSGWVASKPSAKVIPGEAQMISDNVHGPKMICYHWYHERCSRGDSCKLAHSTDNNLPVALKPGSVPCRYWQSGVTCFKGEKCTFSHGFTDSRPEVHTSQVNTNTDDFGIPSGEASPLSQHESKSTPKFGDDETIDFEMDTVPDRPPLEPNLAESAPSNFGDYPAEKTVQSTSTRVKSVTIVSEDQPISLDFTSVPLDASDFASTQTVNFDHWCTAQDFKLRYGHLQQNFYWQQNIGTNTTDKAGCDIVNRLAEYLCLRKAGLVCISYTYIVLLYPAMAEEWKYLDALPNVSTGTTLKYIAFSLQSPIQNFIEAPTINHTSSTDLSFKDMIMKRFHHLDYERLILEQKAKKPVNLCLVFLESANPIAELMTSWLRSCSKDSNIYNYQKPGSWDYFKKHSNAGVVLIHWSALCLIPDTDLIRDMTAGVNYTFWCIEDSKSIVPFSFNRYYKIPKPELGQIVTRQLFPLGYAILLTPSFLVAEPVMTLHFLKWYQKKLKSSIIGSVKVLCCHDLPKFLGELFISKVAEQQEFMKSHVNDPLLLSKLDAKGLSQDQCAARLELHSLLWDIMSKDLPHLPSIDRDPSVETSRSPFFFAPSWIDQNDEKTLVAWFAGWAYSNLDKYRRFYVIGSKKSKKDVEGLGTNHIILNRWDHVFKSLSIQY